MARTTTVTHPDSTVSKRSSARAEYGFAVEVKTDEREHAARLRAEADANVARQAAMLAAAEGVITEERKPWPFGGDRVTVHVGGEYATAWNTDRDERPSEEAAREAVREFAAQMTAGIESRRRSADALDAGPEFTYGVYRWSRTEALAAKGAKEVTWLRGRSSVRVVPVDEA
jgi:hypothetical protein